MMFLAFTVLTLIMTAIVSYLNQMRIYKNQKEETLWHVASYLENTLKADGLDFAYYQEYFLAHSKELLVPHDFAEEEVQVSRHRFESLFAQTYPGKAFGTDVKF